MVTNGRDRKVSSMRSNGQELRGLLPGRDVPVPATPGCRRLADLTGRRPPLKRAADLAYIRR
jgi:hypothetical protein